MAFTEDTGFKTNDSLWVLTRKILSRLNQGISTTGGGGGGGGGAVTIMDGTASGGATVTGSNALKVDGSAVAQTVVQATAASLNATVVQGTAANLKSQVSSLDGGLVTLGTTTDVGNTATDATSVTLVGSTKGVISVLNSIFTVLNSTGIAVNAVTAGNIGGFTSVTKVTPTITSGSAYAAGNVVGGIQTWTAFRISQHPTGILESLILLDQSNQKAPMDIFLFQKNPTGATTTDHGAFAWGTNDVDVIARVSIAGGDYATVAGEAVAIKTGLGIALKITAALSTSLWAVAVTSGTPTYTSTTALVFTWGILQD